MNPQVSVVIPARNAASTIALQLEALACQDTRWAYEIVVVDDGSSDDTAEIVRAFAAKDARVRLLAGRARGANAARNDGIRASRSERVLLCDADDVVCPIWVDAMVDGLGGFDLVGGRLAYDQLNNPDVASTLDVGMRALPAVFGRTYAVSANLGVRRSVVDRIGGFDEEFPVGADDVDFSWRASLAGFELGFVDDAVVQYRIRTPVRRWMRQQYTYALGEALLYAKHEALGSVPRRTSIEQLRSLLARARKLLGLLPAVGSYRGRRRLLREVAWLGGRIVGGIRYGTFV